MGNKKHPSGTTTETRAMDGLPKRTGPHDLPYDTSFMIDMKHQAFAMDPYEMILDYVGISCFNSQALKVCRKSLATETIGILSMLDDNRISW